MVQPKGNTDSNLSDKHEVFCKEYLIDLNGNQAAIRAGYAPDSARITASKLLTDANILARIKELMDERSKITLVDATFVVESLKELFARCMQKKPVMHYDPSEKAIVQKKHVNEETGEEVGIWEFDSTGANRALELLGKHLAMFTDKTNQNLNHSGSLQITGMNIL